MDIFDLSAKLSLDSGNYEKGLGNAEKSTSSFASKLKSGLATAGKIGAAAIGAVTTAAGFLSKTIIDGTREVAAYGDNIDKASQKMGISAEAYQEWDAVLQHSGSSIDSMGRGMLTLAKKAQSGSDAFEKLGLSVDDVASMSQEDLFSAVIAGLQEMEEGTERSALAAELLGGSAKELGPLLNTSAKDTAEMKKRVKELGGVMSNDAVKAAAKYQDSLQDMQTALDGAKRGIVTEFLPAVTSVMDGLTEIFSGDSDKGIGMISDGIEQFVDNISESMPKILEFGSQILVSLADAIIANLPTLISAATDTIMTLVNGLVENLPEIIEVGLQVIIAFAEGIVENLPELIPTIVDVVLKIVDILTDPDTLSNLIDAAIAIIIALANGIIDALPKLIEKAPEIIENLVTAIIENAPKLLDAAVELIEKLWEGIKSCWQTIKGWGKEIIDKIWTGITLKWREVKEWGSNILSKIGDGFTQVWEDIKGIGSDIVRGIWEGIKNMGSWISDKVGGFFGGIVDGIKDFLGIASPSKVFAQIGAFSAEGFGVGFDKAFASVADDVESQIGAITNPSVNINGSGSSGGMIGTLGKVEALLTEIRDKDNVIVLDDGTLVGRVDKMLGQTAMWKARGNA